MLLGAHCSTSGGPHTAIQRARQIGAEACQIFVKNNMQWAGKPFAAAQLKAYHEELGKQPLPVFGHTGYLINVASPPGVTRDRSIQSLIQELELAESLGLPFIVLHPGAHLGEGEAKGIELAAAGLDDAIEATRRLKVRIALENTAGQGSCLGYKFEHLAAILDRVSTPARYCVCLDTAHLLASGYDIRDARGWNAAMKEAESLIGLERIAAFHLNDSKTDLGSRVDRHEHIGQGKIGTAGFRSIVRDPRFKNHPACLETPKSEDLHEDVRNLDVLRGLGKR